MIHLLSQTSSSNSLPQASHDSRYSDSNIVNEGSGLKIDKDARKSDQADMGSNLGVPDNLIPSEMETVANRSTPTSDKKKVYSDNPLPNGCRAQFSILLKILYLRSKS